MCNYCLVKTIKQLFWVENGDEGDKLRFIDLEFYYNPTSGIAFYWHTLQK